MPCSLPLAATLSPNKAPPFSHHKDWAKRAYVLNVRKRPTARLLLGLASLQETVESSAKHFKTYVIITCM
jgi:hypothetical protein